MEREYQKRVRDDGIRRRPDIIIHIPTPDGANRRIGNFAVFELKLAASPAEACQDFDALDALLDALDYPFGPFVNIASERTHAANYAGAFPIACTSSLCGVKTRSRA